MIIDYKIELPNGMGESIAPGIPGRYEPARFLAMWAECWSHGHRKALDGEVVMRDPDGLVVIRAHIKTTRDWVATVAPIEG